MTPSDAECIRKCAEGDTEAFANIVRRYMRLVYVTAYAYVKDEHLSNDMAQEAFLKAFRLLGQMKKPEQMASWLVEITKGVCIDRMRHLKGRVREGKPAEISLESLLEGRGALSLSGEEEFFAAEQPEDALGGPEAAPSAELDRGALRKAVLEKINALPDEYREALILRHVKELSPTEIRKALGLSQASLAMRLHRARQALRESLGPLLKHLI